MKLAFAAYYSVVVFHAADCLIGLDIDFVYFVTARPTDVIYFKTAESEGPVLHSTQKPVALARYLIKTYSQEGDLILDNTFGSGSFLVGAALEKRFFCGIEKNKEVSLFKKEPINYIEVALKRLREVMKKNIKIYKTK